MRLRQLVAAGWAVMALAAIAMVGCDRDERASRAEDDDAPKKKKKKREDAPAASPSATPPAPPPRRTLPRVAAPPIENCAAKTLDSRAYRPSVDFVRAALAELPEPGCSDSASVAAAYETCASQSGSATPSFDVESPRLSACGFAFVTTTDGARRFLRISNFVGEGSQFHGRIYVVEDRGGLPVSYLVDFTGSLALCGGSDDLRPEAANARRDWPALAQETRDFLCEKSDTPPPPPPETPPEEPPAPTPPPPPPPRPLGPNKVFPCMSDADCHAPYRCGMQGNCQRLDVPAPKPAPAKSKCSLGRKYFGPCGRTGCEPGYTCNEDDGHCYCR